MVDTNWRYWQLLDPATGQLRWLAVSRPDARGRVARTKLWTLLPDKRLLIANWFVSQDHQRPPAEREWEHDSITGWDFCDAAIVAPLPSAEDLARVTRPTAVLTFEQIDRIPLQRVVGRGEYERIVEGRAGSPD